MAAIPAMFLVDDAEGRIVRQWTGRIDLDEVARAAADALEDGSGP